MSAPEPHPEGKDSWAKLHEIAKSSGGYNEEEAADSAFARILTLGGPKLGKTTALVTTAPGPVAVLNCDGDSALKYPAKLGAKYVAFDVENMKDWKNARTFAAKAVDAGARTVILDSMSLLADNLLDEISMQFSGFDRFTELYSQLMGGIKKLLRLPAHVFIVAHITASHEEAGVVPLVAGKSKEVICGVVHDIVRFEYSAESSPARRFIVGPQKDWTFSGRNVKRSCTVPAEVPALFKELGIAL